MQSFTSRQIAVATFLATALVIGWDISGLDLAMARWSGGPSGFPLQDNWLLNHVFHEGARRIAWGLVLLLCVGVWLPAGPLQRLSLQRRLQLAVTTLLSVTVIGALKVSSVTSCPWSLAEFGGIVQYASHWSHWFVPDGGSGGCFPAGHASCGFAFLGGYFAVRESSPAAARKWFVVAVLAGVVLGFAQQLRGAHFMSHTLWTGLICWCVAWGTDATFGRFAPREVDTARGKPLAIQPAQISATPRIA
ncbi:MAG: phosphatase PAP2 family protein [Comamonadaceae bacterium]|nr:MAG: phosphatase PAP2 family protein [Comamonadaceae bacterium]